MTDVDSKNVKKPRSGLFWMLLPLLLLGTSVSGWLVMVSIAVDDPGFAVEADYYKKAASYDDVIEQRRANAKLGWRLTAPGFTWARGGKARLVVLLTDAEGEPLSDRKLSAEVFFNARAGRLQKLELSPLGKGMYGADVAEARPGLWEARVLVSGSDTFRETLRLELPRLVGASRAGPHS